MEFRKEMECIFGRGYSPLWLPTIYSDVKERCLKKAFKTLFLKDHSDIYENAKASAITLWQNRKTETEFSVFLVNQLEDSGVCISEEISKIFKNDFLDTLEKEFSALCISYQNKACGTSMFYAEKFPTALLLGKVKSIRSYPII